MTTDRLLGFDPGPDVTVVVTAHQDPKAARAAFDSAGTQRTPSGRPQVLLLAGEGRFGAGDRWTRRAAGKAGVEVLPTASTEPLPEGWNRALERARGRYVLLLGRGSRLLPDALSAMVSLADRAESDVVVDGATGADEIERVDLAATDAFRALDGAVLLRTSMIRRTALRFAPGATPGAERLLVAEALLVADAVSVLGRTAVDRSAVPAERETAAGAVAVAGGLLELLAREVPAGGGRDALVQLVVATDLARGTGPLLGKERSGEQREAALTAARELLGRFLTPGVLGSLPGGLAVRYRLIERGLFVEAEAVALHQQRKTPAPRIVHDGRLYAQYPFFRDSERPVPDEVYDVSHELTVTQELTRLAWSGRNLVLEGIGFFEQLSTRDRDSELVLRERRTGAVERFPVEAVKDQQLVNAKGRPRSMGRFRRTLDLVLPPSGLVLGPGLWEVHLSVSFEGVRRELPFGAVRDPGADLLAREAVVLLPAVDGAEHELVAHHVVLGNGAVGIEVAERVPVRVSESGPLARSAAG